MSRATVAKSRADKAGKMTSAPTPAVTHEIVPGKCNDQEWNVMLDHDDSDDLVLDMVEEVVDSALSIIYAKYLDQQLIPYAVTQAKNALLQIIEWQFLSCDNGEVNPEDDEGWQEDEGIPGMKELGDILRDYPLTRQEWRDRQAKGKQEAKDAIKEFQKGKVDNKQALRKQWKADAEREAALEEAVDPKSKLGKATTSVPTEPEPAMTDCWAQGSVPKQLLPPTPRSDDLEGLPEEEVARTPTSISEEPDEDTTSTSQREEDSSMEAEEDSEESQPRKFKQPKLPQRRNVKFRPYHGKLNSAGVGAMVQTLAETEMQQLFDELTPVPPKTPDTVVLQMPNSCHSILKDGDRRLQKGRPPGNRDVTYDKAGNVVAISKLNPSRLPTHRVRTGYQVVDPAVEAAQARLEAMRTGRQKQAPSKMTKRTSPRIVTITPASKISDAIRAPLGPAPMGRLQDGVTPLPPPLVEVMEVAPGVVVKEGDRVRHGPKQHARRQELIAHATNRSLYPVRGTAALPTILVTELIGHSSPIIKPLGEARPIPPITPHSPHTYQSVQ